MAEQAPTPQQMEAILNGPALKPPPGVEPNFVDPYTLQPVLIGLGAACLFITTLVTALRGYTRMFIIKHVTAADYTCFLGWALFVAMVGVSLMFAQYGGGAHQWNIQVKNMISVAFWLHVTSIIYGLAFLNVKISILTQYREVFTPAKQRNFMFWITWILSLIILLFYGLVTIFEIVLCQPMEAAWNPLVPGSCFNSGVIITTTGAFNTITDFILLVLPQRVIWNLNLPKKRRIAIASVFLIGFFACISSCFRLYYSVLFLLSPDVSFAAAQFGLWTYAELTSGLLCACLPSLPRFMQKTILSTNVYSRLRSSIRSLVTSRSSQGASNFASNSTGYHFDQSRPYQRSSDTETGFKNLSQTQSEWEMQDRSFSHIQQPRDIGITKTVDIQSNSARYQGNPA